MPFATTPDGTRLYWETHGKGAPLLLISGQAFDHNMWAGGRDDFAAHFQVIVYDQRGTGQSDKPEQPPCSTRGFAQDACCVLDAVGVTRAHVYGFSMGGRIAQWLAIDHPARVGALVLGASTPGNAHGVKRGPEVDAALSSGNPARLQDTLVSPEWGQGHPEWLAMMAERASHPLPPHAQKQHYLASEGHDAWDDLPRVVAPTLVVHGTADEVNPTANGTLLAQRIPGATLHLIEGARHGYFWSHRTQASPVVIDFLKAQQQQQQQPRRKGTAVMTPLACALLLSLLAHGAGLLAWGPVHRPKEDSASMGQRKGHVLVTLTQAKAKPKPDTPAPLPVPVPKPIPAHVPEPKADTAVVAQPLPPAPPPQQPGATFANLFAPIINQPMGRGRWGAAPPREEPPPEAALAMQRAQAMQSLRQLLSERFVQWQAQWRQAPLQQACDIRLSLEQRSAQINCSAPQDQATVLSQFNELFSIQPAGTHLASDSCLHVQEASISWPPCPEGPSP